VSYFRVNTAWAVSDLTLSESGVQLGMPAAFRSQIGGALVQKTICERPCSGVEEQVEHTTHISPVFYL
jgi:MOSC domain-containing protein YiiM